MKKLFLSLILFLGCASLLADITVPRSVGTVVYADDASPAEKHAAMELASHLKEVCGTELSVLPESRIKPDTKSFYVGKTKFALANGIDFDKFSPEEWLIRARSGSIVISGGQPRGALYGVYEFLERFAGVAWLDEHYTDFAKRGEVVLPENLDLQGKPFFRYRGQYTWHGHDQTMRFLFRSRCRENIFFQETLEPELEKKLGHTPVLGSPSPLNTLYFYINEWPQTGFEEGYSLDEAGKRVRPNGVFGPGQVCFTSQMARDKFAEQMIGYIRKDREKYPESYPLLYNLSVNDINHICHCQNCRAGAKKYGTESGIMLEFVNYVAEKAGRVYPDVTIQTSAYLVYEASPARGIKPAKNVTVRLSPSRWGSQFDTMRSLRLPRNAKTMDFLTKWSKLGKVQIWNYWVLFGNSSDKNACIINIDTIQENLKVFRDLGSNYVFSECEYPENTTFHALRVWIGYKLKCNPDQPIEPLIDRFMTGYYGKAAPFMRRYYDYLVKRQQSAPELDAPTLLQRCYYFDAEFFKTVEDLLKKAMTAVEGDSERQIHVKNELVPFDIARIVIKPDLPGFSPDMAQVKARLFENWHMLSKRFLTGITRKRSLDEIALFFKMHEEKKSGAKYPIPKSLEGRELYEITFPEFNCAKSLAFYGVRFNDDKEAAGGKALGVDKTERIADIDGFHAKKFNIGFQDRTNKRSLRVMTLPKNKIPKDEKFHFYPAGTVTLAPSTLLWMHETWYLQQDLSNMYNAKDPGGNRYEVYVSLKFTGPAYVKDSKSQNGFWMDRILLVRPKK